MEQASRGLQWWVRVAGAIPPDSAGDELGRGLGKVEEGLGKMLARGARRMVARDGRGGDGGGSA